MPTRRTMCYASLAVGAVSVAISCALFFGVVAAPEHPQLMGLYSLVFGEVVATLCFAVMEGRNQGQGNAFGKAGVYTATIIYLLAASVLALVYITGMGTSVVWLLALHGGLFGGLCLVLVLVAAFSRTLAARNAQVLAAKMQFTGLVQRLHAVGLQHPEAAWLPQLRQCQEGLRFFDHSYMVPQDAHLEVLVSRLEGAAVKQSEAAVPGFSGMQETVEELALLIAQRKQQYPNQKGNI